MSRALLDVAQSRLDARIHEHDALTGVEERTAPYGPPEGDLHPPGRGGLREAGGGVVRVHDDDITWALMPNDRLLGGPVPLEATVELQMVGPERDHGGEAGAVPHERQVRARQLQ